MTRQTRKAAVPPRPRTPSPPSHRSEAERALARAAILAREVLAAEPEREPVREVPHWPLVGSMLIH